MGCRWNRLDEPIFVAVSFFGLTGILYLEKSYALCLASLLDLNIRDNIFIKSAIVFNNLFDLLPAARLVNMCCRSNKEEEWSHLAFWKKNYEKII